MNTLDILSHDTALQYVQKLDVQHADARAKVLRAVSGEDTTEEALLVRWIIENDVNPHDVFANVWMGRSMGDFESIAANMHILGHAFRDDGDISLVKLSGSSPRISMYWHREDDFRDVFVAEVQALGYSDETMQDMEPVGFYDDVDAFINAHTQHTLDRDDALRNRGGDGQPSVRSTDAFIQNLDDAQAEARAHVLRALSGEDVHEESRLMRWIIENDVNPHAVFAESSLASMIGTFQGTSCLLDRLANAIRIDKNISFVETNNTDPLILLYHKNEPDFRDVFLNHVKQFTDISDGIFDMLETSGTQRTRPTPYEPVGFFPDVESYIAAHTQYNVEREEAYASLGF